MNEPGPERSTMITRWGAVVRRLPTEDWLVIGWVFATEIILLIFGVRSFHMIEDKRVPAHLGWLEIWNRWDALHFQRIAEAGYSASDKLKAWFYPLYPWCVRWTAYLTGSTLVAAFVVSGIALLVAALIFRRLIALDFSTDVARRGVWFFLIFPTAYYLHIGYTESLFLALALASILAARIERWWLAGLLGAFCWMTRGTGAILVPALAIEATQQYCSTRRWKWRWLWIAVVPLGFAVYLLINWHVSGDALAFLQTRKISFKQWFALPSVGIRHAISAHYLTPNEAEMVGAQELQFVALGFVCMLISWIKLRPVYAVWMTGTWLLFTAVNLLQSVPRYTLTMFPRFILFALLGRNRFWFGALTVWSLLFFALFAVLFARGEWAF